VINHLENFQKNLKKNLKTYKIYFTNYIMCKLNLLYKDKSYIEGNGLFCKESLQIGDCIGLLARVYGDDNFDDKPFGRNINHSNNSNIDLKLIKDRDNQIIYVLGIANKYINKGEELTANYNHTNAPKPNFINRKSFNFDKKIK